MLRLGPYLETPTTIAPIEENTTQNVNFITTLAARRNRLLKKEKNSFRRRKVKRVKGARKIKNEINTENKNLISLKKRKRLPFIRKKSTILSSTTTLKPKTTNKLKILNSGRFIDISKLK